MEEEKRDLPAVIPTNLAPAIVTGMAGEAATALLEVVDKAKMIIKVRGQKYLKYEGWQTLGTFMGRAYGGPVTVGSDDAEPVFDDGKFVGFKAHARAWCNGQVISEAVAYCFTDEKNWKDKPAFQIASMAQTRASSKALRNVLGWVLTLAGADIKTTPAEEMEDDGPPSDMFTSLLGEITDAKTNEDLDEAVKKHQAAWKGKKITAAENDDLKERGKAKRAELKKAK